MVVLKGSVWGSASNPKTYKSPDILYSKLLNKRYTRNMFEVVNDRGLAIYHLFSNTDSSFTDEWFNTSQTGIKYNKDKMMITCIIPEYSTKRKTHKKLPVKIYFTEKGWRKLMMVKDTPK